MLGLCEDALVQYDELDALFTQFILNHAAGGTSADIRGGATLTLYTGLASYAKDVDTN